MNDLDMVRAVLDDVPEPAPARLAAGRARLLAAATTGGGTRRPNRRVLLPAALTAAAAAVAAILAVALAGAPAAGPVTALGTPQSASLVAKVLGTAARVVAARPVTEPRPGQWFYYRSVDSATGQSTQTDDEWITFDGSKSAYFGPGGQLTTHIGPVPRIKGTDALAAFDTSITPLTSYNALAALPASPRALLAAVDAELARAWSGQDYFGVTGKATTKPQREFAWLGLLLWNAYAAAPPPAVAAVYQAIATIPGVSVDQHVTDAAGRSAIGVTDDQGQTEILLNPATYQPIGLIVRSAGAKLAKPAPGYSLSSTGALASPVPMVTHTYGPQTSSIAIVRVSEVSGPGQR
ncbi:MAG TPA: CU044_5270 family protein [Streptosporangiaceae bacterium]|nr:CU044_5270 family protein [Streptosporangiaceae bacterium]